MRISNFEYRDKRSVKFARCEKVPRLMIVAGPNGSGKSTLLYEMRNSGGRQNILYVGPHRASRRQHVQHRHLIGETLLLSQILAQDNMRGVDGIAISNGQRDAWNGDEAPNFIKHSLCQVEIDRQQAIAARLDKYGEIPKGSIEDPWKPLRELVHSLLPHLNFERIDNSNRDSVRCLFSVHSTQVVVDLDDLSSGEKSVIQMFYPLVEHRVREVLKKISGAEELARPAETCVIIDEPELHLHPNLQVKVLDYLRVLSSSANTQFVVATHSPTIVEAASFDELFLLRPVELVPPGDNQLVQIATDEEKLRVLRELFGTTSNVTSMQHVVVVEGTDQDKATALVSDRKLYRALNRGFDGVTLVPGGGKSECIKLVEAFNRVFPRLSPTLKACALLDSDVMGAPPPNVCLLPVSMIENFLLDPLPLWEAIQSVIEKTGFRTIEDLTAALDAVLDRLEGDEVERRAKATLGQSRFRPESPIADVPEKAQQFAASIVERYSADTVAVAVNEARNKVTVLRDGKQRREQFHGKAVLDEFYKQHLHNTGLAKSIFKFEAARHARERKAVLTFFRKFFSEIVPINKTEP